jgi:nicotinamide-nucleotide amidase
MAMRGEPLIDDLLKRRAKRTVAALKTNKLTVVTAESCTAGLLAACLSKPDGAGDVLHGGFVCYSKEQKNIALGVSLDLLKERSAVSPEVVETMAKGALHRSPADMAVAISGVLGPNPDEDNNPIGLVYICLLRRDHAAQIVRKEFGSRAHDQVCALTLQDAFDLLDLSDRKEAASGNALRHRA